MSSTPSTARSSQDRATDTNDRAVPSLTPGTVPYRAPVSNCALATLVVAPVLMVAGAMIHPAESSDGVTQMAIVSDHAARWALSHDLLVLGSIVMVGAVLALGQALRPAAPRTARIGATLGVLGCGGLVGLFALEGFGAHALLGLDGAAAGTALDSLAAETMASFAPVSLALTIGLIVLGIGLLRSRIAPVWAGAALVAGAAGLMAGVVTEVGVVAGTGQIVMTVAMIGIAQRLHCGPKR